MGWNLHFSSRRRTVQPVWLQLCCKSDAGNTRESFKNIPICLGLAAEPACMGKKKKDLLQNSVSSLVKGIYFILNVIPPKQILFLNLSLSLDLGRAAAACCSGMLQARMCHVHGQAARGADRAGEPHSWEKSTRLVPARGQGVICHIQTAWDVFISSRPWPQSHPQDEDSWAPVGAESDPNPIQTPTPAPPRRCIILFYYNFIYTHNTLYISI